MKYLQIHAIGVYQKYTILRNKTEDPNRQKILKKYMNDLCALIILTLRKLPDSEVYVAEWGSRLEFQYPIRAFTDAHELKYTMIE